MKLLDFPQLHCPRCAARYMVKELTGWGTLVLNHPSGNYCCMDDGKEVRVLAKEVDVDWPPADVQQAQAAAAGLSQQGDVMSGRVGGYAYEPSIGDYVPVGHVPRAKPRHVADPCEDRVKVSEPVSGHPIYRGQHYTDRGDKLTQRPDGCWYYA